MAEHPMVTIELDGLSDRLPGVKWLYRTESKPKPFWEVRGCDGFWTAIRGKPNFGDGNEYRLTSPGLEGGGNG